MPSGQQSSSPREMPSVPEIQCREMRNQVLSERHFKTLLFTGKFVISLVDAGNVENLKHADILRTALICGKLKSSPLAASPSPSAITDMDIPRCWYCRIVVVLLDSPSVYTSDAAVNDEMFLHNITGDAQ